MNLSVVAFITCICQFLALRGMEPNQAAILSDSPPLTVVIVLNAAATKVLIEKTDGRGYQALHRAAELLDLPLARGCLECGADVNQAVRSTDTTPLKLTINRGAQLDEKVLTNMPKMLELLCKYNVKVDNFDIYTFTTWIKHYPEQPTQTILQGCLNLLKQQRDKQQT